MNNEIFSIFHENQFFTPFLNIFFADASKNLRARYIKNRSLVLADFLTYDRHHAYNLIEPLDRSLKQFSLISSIKRRKNNFRKNA